MIGSEPLPAGVDILVSSAFYPSSLHSLFPTLNIDTILISLDGVFFYVSGDFITKASSNGFGGLLEKTPGNSPHLPMSGSAGQAATNARVYPVPEPSAVLNLLLLWIHQM